MVKKGRGESLMCGICGYYSNKKHAPEAVKKFSSLLVASSVRGEQACGVSYVSGKAVKFIKRPITASEFVKSEGFLSVIAEAPTIAIGHTRLATNGKPEDNHNNHPVLDRDNGLALVHNGIITNDFEIFKNYHLAREGVVDSEAIVKLIGYFMKKGNTIPEAMQKASGKLRGGLACAMLAKQNPKTLYLLASTNPISFAYDKKLDTLFFASTGEILTEALAEYRPIWGGLFYEEVMDGITTAKLADDTGLEVTRGNYKSFTVTRPTWYQAPTKTKYQHNWLPKKKKETDISLSFNQYLHIEKPSKHTTAELKKRLSYLQGATATKDQREFLGAILPKYELEIRRIKNTLEGRNGKPTPKDKDWVDEDNKQLALEQNYADY